jgi:hypothetical protein
VDEQEQRPESADPSAEDFAAALARAGIAAAPAERARALAAARRLRGAVARLRAWNAEHDDKPA